MNTWISSGAFKSKRLSKIFRIAEAIGCKNIELSSGIDYHVGANEFVLKKFNEGFNLLVHNYFPAPKEPFVLNVSCREEPGKSETRGLAQNGIWLAGEMQSDFYSLHAGFAADLRADELGKPEKQVKRMTGQVIDRKAAYQSMIEMLCELADYAQSLKVKLLVENNVLSKVLTETYAESPLLMVTGHEIQQLMCDISHPNVGILFDVAHAKVSAQTLNASASEMFEKASEYIGCIHLSDNDGELDNNKMFSSEAWFWPQVREMEYAAKVVEVYDLTGNEILNQLDILGQVLK